jgi:hypothetical protein
VKNNISIQVKMSAASVRSNAVSVRNKLAGINKNIFRLF